MTIGAAEYTSFDTRLAEVKIAIVANAAMIMCVGNSNIAVVAIDGIGGSDELIG